ncbi:MAG: ABC transporter permease subunit [Chloroflexi bacterium]|nr:ABC transporter permease subunit [Chloroflexota bacterium]
MFRLLRQELYFRRNAMIGWGLALCFFPVVYVGLYPSFAEQMVNFQAMMDLAIYQAMGISMGSFEDYMASTVTNLVPVIISIYAVVSGTGTLAGEEDDGRLEMIITSPLPRWQIIATKAIATGFALLVILSTVGLAAALTLANISSQITTEVLPMNVFASLLAAWPLTMGFAMISLFLGAFTPNRRAASAIATAVVLISYLGNNLTGMIESLENLKWIFLFHYFDASANALLNGQVGSNVVALLLFSLAAFGLAAFFFQRRDITVGVWPWQKGKLPA